MADQRSALDDVANAHITGGTEFSALQNVEARTDAEYAERVFSQHEERINISRRESYLSATNVLRVKEAKEGKKDVEWDKLDVPQLAEILGCPVSTGLSETEAKMRHERDGPNELEKPKRPGLITLFILQVTNLIILLLVAAACASLIVNSSSPNRDDPISYVESIAIFVIVFINSAIGAVTENAAAGALEALSKLAQPKATVFRDGKEASIASTKIVKGDIVLLQTGDIVPADVRLIDADDLKVNEMLLTGEPDDVSKFARMKKKKKSDDAHGEKLTPENMAFSSCMCTNGKTKAFVVEIGMNTRVGRIAKLLTEQDNNKYNEPTGDGTAMNETAIADTGKEPSKKKAKKNKGPCCGLLPDTTANQTPLQRSLQNLGVKIGIFAILACVVVFIVGVSLDVKDLDNRDSQSWLYMIIVAVTLAVAAIPEGIPLCVTISLSTGCSDMVKKNVLVRRIAAVETLGCASVICTDKTGTLTEGKMSMVKMWAAGIDFNVSGKGFDPTVGKITYKDSGEDASSCTAVISSLASAVLCCNTKVMQEIDPDDGKAKWIPHGNSSEAPIIVAGGKIGLWSEKLELGLPRIYEVPFSSSRKMMLIVNKLFDDTGSDVLAKSMFPGFFEKQHSRYLANVKGAPNFILNDCDSWTTSDGKVVPLTEDDKQSILARVDQLSSEALRVLAIAARPMETMPFDYLDKELEMDTDQKFKLIVKQPGLVLLGLVASIDPERDGVPQAVLDAQGGHIRVVMITGDYLPTAVAIAHNVNILKSDDDENACALDCGKLRPDGNYLDDDEIDHLTKTVKVFARAQPEDKLQIVKSLQRQGLVSAMTGDGVNDAPALKRADIGVAMGIQGTEVAKGASDMILTDDNFCSIVTAVEKGRIIYSGIQKFVVFILSVHLAEVLQIFICIVAQIPIMRTPLQILFLILVTDLPPSIALGMERVARDILKDRPRPKKQPIILFWQWQGIVVSALVLASSTLFVYTWALNFYVESYTVDDIANRIIEESGGDATADTNTSAALRHARTTAFVSLVWSENFRAYTSRSFYDPVWVDLCANPVMQKAIFLAQVALYCACFIPGFSNKVMELEGTEIGWEGWVAALVGSFYTLIGCEIYKFLSRAQIRAAEKRVADELERLDEENERLAEERRKALASKTERPGATAAKT